MTARASPAGRAARRPARRRHPGRRCRRRPRRRASRADRQATRVYDAVPRLPDQPTTDRPPPAGGHAEHRPATHDADTRRPAAACAAPDGSAASSPRRRRGGDGRRRLRPAAPRSSDRPRAPTATRRDAAPGPGDGGRRRRRARARMPAEVRGRATSRGCPWRSVCRSRAGRVATAARSARASALNWDSTMWWASRPYEHADVQRDPGVVREGLEDVPGQRAAYVRRRSRRTPAPPAPGVHAVRAAGRGRRPPGRAPRPAARSRRRTGRCRACRRAPRAGRRRARWRCPRRCGGRRCATSPLGLHGQVEAARAWPSWSSMWS